MTLWRFGTEPAGSRNWLYTSSRSISFRVAIEITDSVSARVFATKQRLPRESIVAQPGETVLSEATWNTLTTTPDRFEKLGEQLVKGRDTPVIAYRLPGAGQPEPQPPEPQRMGAS